ncbi:MAG: hypothetical protein EOM87_01825 [Clostridia bacterium]|nr:hypothetical protein [Clostridia bacterium]
MFALLFIFAGIGIGVVFSYTTELTEYHSHLNNIILNIYNPFTVFFKIALFSTLCVILTYVYMAGRWARVIPYFIVFYCGYLIGRAALLDIMICKVVGLISFFLFTLPCYLALLFAVIVFLIYLKQRAFCGLHNIFLGHNFYLLKYGFVCLGICLLIQFMNYVILAGVLKIILNI